MLGREEQERVTGIKATAIAPPNSQEDKAYNENLMQVAKVFTFRNMSVSIDDLMFVCIEPGIERTYKFQVLMVKINKWSSGWQGKMWGSQSWLQHVSTVAPRTSYSTDDSFLGAQPRGDLQQA